MVDGAQAGGPKIAQPTDLDGGRLAGQRWQAAAVRQSRQVHQDVDAVLLNAGGQGVIAQVENAVPVRHVLLEALGDFVFGTLGDVGKQFNLRGVMVLEQGLQEIGAGMLSKVPRQVAHTQPPRRLAVVAVAPGRDAMLNGADQVVGELLLLGSVNARRVQVRRAEGGLGGQEIGRQFNGLSVSRPSTGQVTCFEVQAGQQLV